MASMTMTSTFLGTSATPITKQVQTANHRRGAIAIKASLKGVAEGEKIEMNNNIDEAESTKGGGGGGRRDLVFSGAAAAAAAVAVFGLSKIAMADSTTEPPRGSLEAKKKYAPVCVTMPTARICHK